MRLRVHGEKNANNQIGKRVLFQTRTYVPRVSVIFAVAIYSWYPPTIVINFIKNWAIWNERYIIGGNYEVIRRKLFESLT